MRKFVSLILWMCAIVAVAQNYQKEPSKLWGNWCYKEVDGKWSSASNGQKALEMPTSPQMVVAYYWRIPNGHVRADIVWATKSGVHATLNVKVSYPTTGEVLGEFMVTNKETTTSTQTQELFSDINFPKDDFYRVELSCSNWSQISSIQYFNVYHESALPALAPRNIGGTSAHMFDWGSTDPNAPKGNAYDWAYVECMVPEEYQYPGTYYMTMGALNSYMGMQTTDAVGDGDFNRNILFSVWDNGNTDEDPNLPDYMKSGVMEGHPEAYQTHGGGEGSSSSCMLSNTTKWWRPNKWVQFILNTRPETTTVTVNKNGKDSTFLYENTIMTVFYKMHDDPSWTFLGTLRASGVNDMIAGWYSFIEPFSTYAGQFKHRAYYRNGFMRAANSGKWYSRNKVALMHDQYDRDFHYDFGRGATDVFENCFFLDMGGYVAQNDSADVIPLARNTEAVDTINIARLEERIDSAIRRDSHYEFNARMFATAKDVRRASITVASSDKNAKQAFDGNEATIWGPTGSFPHVLDLKFFSPTELTSMSWYWAYQYDYRCRYMDVYSSKDGKKWELVFDSLEIRTVDRPTVRFPQPFKTQYVRFKFYHPFRAGNLMFNEIYLKGSYDDAAVKALAKDYLDKAGQFNSYDPKALENLKQVYNDGNPSSTADLVNALFALSENADNYKYARVAKLVHLSSQRAYRIENMNGYGVLSADKNGTTIKGATIAGAKDEYKSFADVSDDYNNWMIIHDEVYSGYYLYNIGAGKFFNNSVEGNLSDNPQSISLKESGKGYTFNISSKAIGVNSTDDGVTTLTSTSKQCQFYIYDNYVKVQSVEKRDSLLKVVEPIGKYALYQTAARKLLAAPVGVVGGFVSDAARDAFNSTYRAADEEHYQEFIDAVDNADVIVFNPETTLYRLKNAYGGISSAPYMTSSATNYVSVKSKNTDVDKVWRFMPKGLGYTMTSQGRKLMPQPLTSGERVTLTSDEAEAGMYLFSSKTPAEFYMSNADFSEKVVNAASSPLTVASNTTNASTWYLEPYTTMSVKTNDLGVATLYYDFSIEIPEGLCAFVAKSISAEGVIKLEELSKVIPAGTGVIVKGAPNETYTVNVFNSKERLTSDNLLKGVYFRNNALTKGTVYTLSANDEKVVMTKPALTVVNANQCYLSSEDAPELETLTFDFDDIIEGVASSINYKKAGTKHNLWGLPVIKTQKGQVYIEENRAILMK